MLALITLLLLIPVGIFQKVMADAFIYFLLGIIFFFMSREYVRRMKYAGIVNANKPVVVINLMCMASFFLYLAY